MAPRFDDLSSSYHDLLRDPIRDRFGGGDSAFFHLRKSTLIRDYFRAAGVDTRKLAYLDVGCGKGELLECLRPHFARVAGCDVSAEMMQGIRGVETRVQKDPVSIPYSEDRFDFITAVCVYHHIAPSLRLALSREIARVLRPGGVFAIVEHNPFNPVTRLIVRRTPIDSDAILLKPSEVGRLMAGCGLFAPPPKYFLYFPRRLFRLTGNIESLLSVVPLGGQYVVFATKRPGLRE